MFLSSISSRFLNLPVWSFWHCNSKDPVSVMRKLVNCFACCLWICSGKSSEGRTSSYDCSSSSMLRSSLLLYAMLLGFLGTVYSSSSVTVGVLLSLVAQAIDHFRYFVLFPQASPKSTIPRFRSLWISSVADSSRGVMETNYCWHSAPDRF